MFRAALSKMWEQQKIYVHTYQEVWVGVILTGCLYYKINYGGKKRGKTDTKAIGHH